MSSPPKAQKKEKTASRSTIVAITSTLGLLVGVLFENAMMASYFIAIETSGCKDFHSEEWAPFNRVGLLKCVTLVLTSVAALYELVSNISPSVPIDQLLAVYVFHFLLGVGALCMGFLASFWEWVAGGVWLMSSLLAVYLFCMKKNDWEGEEEGKDQGKGTRSVAFASLVLGMAIGQLTFDTTLGIRFVVLVRVGCQDFQQYYLDHGNNITAFVCFGGLVAFVDLLSAMEILKNLVTGIHQGGNNLLPSSRVCHIFLVNAFFGYQCALIAAYVAMGLPIGMYHVTGVLWACVMYCICKWEQKKCEEIEDDDCSKSLEEPLLALEQEEAGDSKDEDNINTGVLMTAVAV